MTKNEALQDLKNELHVSHSQIFTYLNCSLKYRFMYVEARPQERVSIALPFGKSIHASLERQYRVMKEKQCWEPLGVLLNYFEHHINLELDQTEVPIVYKKETPDRDAVIDMGIAMLEAFHENVDLTGFEILEVERPLSARLYTEDGKPTDLKLIGVLDLVLKDEAGRTIVEDIIARQRARGVVAKAGALGHRDRSRVSVPPFRGAAPDRRCAPGRKAARGAPCIHRRRAAARCA